MNNNLKQARINAGLTQRQVAGLLQLNAKDRISKWENGTKYPSVINLFRLARIYKVPADDLYPTLSKKNETY